MTIKEQYTKERRRIQNFIRKAEKRGYQFNYQLPPSVSNLDKITKKMVNELKKTTPEKLYEQSVYGGSESYGEIIKGSEGRKAERSARSKKSATTRRQHKTEQQVIQDIRIIDEIKLMIDNLPDIKWYGFNQPRNYETIKSVLINGLDDTTDEADANGQLLEYLQHLVDHLPEISVATDLIKYDSDEIRVDGAFNQLLSIILKRPLTINEAKNLENFNEYFDGNDLNNED
nr:MAG TPA: hypothetical protein [Caudoviricetes sp.]